MGMAMAKTSSSSSYNLDSLPPPPPPETPNLSNPSAASTTHPLPCQSPGYSLSDPSSVDDRGKRESSIRTWVANQARRIEEEIIRAIDFGNIDSLKPNSRHAITIAGHSVCVYFHDGSDPNYRSWEWHGHVMTGQDNGYMLERIYGNHYERVTEEIWSDEEEDEDSTFPIVIGNVYLRLKQVRLTSWLRFVKLIHKLQDYNPKQTTILSFLQDLRSGNTFGVLSANILNFIAQVHNIEENK